MFFDKYLKLNFITDRFSFLIGANCNKSLFVSHENLDRYRWWKFLGQYLIKSSIYRMTFWPKEIDPQGERFPYWYNYVRWESYPRDNPSQRYSSFLELNKLQSKIKINAGKGNKAVYIGSHLDFPRMNLFKYISNYFDIDSYGAAFGVKVDDKFEMLKKYSFSFCPENSAGYGYDTEKIPESWNAGCLPIGTYLNPYSDFNPKAFPLNGSVNFCVNNEPLLLSEPTLKNIEKYIKKVLINTCFNK